MLIDLLVAMGIIGVVLLAVMPAMRSEGPLQLVAGSSMLSADIEYAQSRTLASPSDPTIVVFGEEGDRYWLARLSDPMTPIDDPDDDPWLRVMGEGNAAQLDGCTLRTHHVPHLPEDGPEAIVFDAFGRLDAGDDIGVEIVNHVGAQPVHVRAATGSVSILADFPDGFTPEPRVLAPGDGGGERVVAGGPTRGGATLSR